MRLSAEDREKNSDLAIKLVFFSFVAAVLAYAVHELKMLIICLIFALTLASALSPLAEWLEKRKIPRLMTVALVYIFVGLLYAGLAATLIPTIIEQSSRLYDNIPAYVKSLNKLYHAALNMAGGSENTLSLPVSDLKNLGFAFVGKTMKLTAGAAGLVVNAVLTLFLTAYFVIEAKSLNNNLLNWLPESASRRLSPLIVPLAGRLGGYVRGQLLVSSCAAVILAGGFSALGIDYALVLGIMAGLLNLLPYVGSLLATIAGVLVAFNQAPLLALAVLALYAFEQWIESSFLVPHLLGKNVELDPLLVIISILCGAALLGVAGALIAVPVTASAVFLLEEFYLKPLKAAETTPESINTPDNQSQSA